MDLGRSRETYVFGSNRMSLQNYSTRVNSIADSQVHLESIGLQDRGILALSSKAITITGSNYRINTESFAPSGVLDTINGGYDGQILYLYQQVAVRDVKIAHATGNIYLSTNEDFWMPGIEQPVILQYQEHLNGGSWVDIGGTTNRETINATADDTTPTVVNALFLDTTANTVNTTITSLDEMLEGQVVTIFCTDANTNIASGASWQLDGGLAFQSGTNGGAITIRKKDSVFYEISRAVYL